MSVTVASTSQAHIVGAETACTAIAVVTCAHWLQAAPSLPPPGVAAMIELWIRQGGALYSKWLCVRQTQDSYAHTQEVVQLVSAAWPIRCAPNREWNGYVSEEATHSVGLFPLRSALNELLLVVVDGAQDILTAVLTVGALSMALRFDPATGTCDLFDSHSQPAHGGHAIGVHFANRQALIDHVVHVHFARAQAVQYSLVQVERRPHLEQPRFFATQQEALDAADVLPPNGFLYVWPCDISAEGTKEYAVAGLEDFWYFYEHETPKRKTFYDLACDGQPVTFYADLEYVRGLRDNATALNPLLMLAQLKAAVVAQWAEEHEGAGPLDDFVVSDSSVLPPPPVDEQDVMSISDSSNEEEEDLGKVSYHVHNQSMWFPNVDSLKAFMLRVEQRTGGTLLVWREWAHVEKQMFFADQNVYTRNRAFRLVGSSKWGQVRPFVPLSSSALLKDHFLATLICPPSLMHYYARQEQESLPFVLERTCSGSSSSSSSSTLHPLQGPHVPPLVAALAQLVERQYQPERMRGYQFTPNALVTFFMVKHDCAICQDRHNNQCYVVADLKTRMHWQKCMADRSKHGPKTPFASPDAPMTLACPEEMDPASCVFAGDSITATMVLAFARAVFASGREPFAIPQQAPIRLMQEPRRGQMYVVDLAAGEARCPKDGGTRHLEVNHKQVVIRCSGVQCKSGRSRLFRPSHSRSEQWDLSFLFPLPTGISLSSGPSAGAVVVVPNDAVAIFMQEGNFFRALSLAGPAPPLTYRTRLDHPDHVTGTDFWDKLMVVRTILTKPLLEHCYRECLGVAPDFCYPPNVIPRNPTMLLQLLFVHLACRQGFKRVGDDFYLPIVDARGRSFYRAVPLDQVVSALCSQHAAPNLCLGVLWNKNAAADVQRMLQDQAHFPKLQLSKRYIGYANVVYDLQANDTLTWDEVRADPQLVPFNYIDQTFPVDALERAKAHCPTVVLNAQTGQVEFRGNSSMNSLVPTPLLDRPLLDQGFDADTTLVWLYVLLGRMFHYVGKTDGDGWEIALCLIGASGTFKSSLVNLLKRYLQKDQFGAIPTPIEPNYPIAGLVGKLVVFMTECKGCLLDVQLFLAMVAGDPVGANAKYKTSATVSEWDSPLLLAGNGFLNLVDRVGAAERRCAVFPFVRTVGPGQKDPKLVNRIWEHEGPLALIKWNTLYWAVRNSNVLSEVRSHLPPQVQVATYQAIVEWDPLRSFLDQQCMVTGNPADQLVWYPRGQQLFRKWCSANGKRYDAVNWQDSDLKQMLALMNVSFVQAASALVGIRVRDLTRDPPFQSVFEVRPMDYAPIVDIADHDSASNSAESMMDVLGDDSDGDGDDE